MRIATLTIALLLLGACGQKGPLYLPQDEPAEASARAHQTTERVLANPWIAGAALPQSQSIHSELSYPTERK